MSDIPRYSVGRGYVIDANDNGPLVKYADHVAALLTQDRQHMEQQAAAVAAAHLAGYKECQQDVINGRGFAAFGRHQWKRDSFDAGVKAARDAVAGLPVLLVDVRFNPDDASRYVGAVNVSDALAAIDALKGEQA